MPAALHPSGNVVWVEGLRGIASVLVVITHLARAWDYDLFFPRDNPDRPPRLLQLPILRVPAQGRLGVPIFALLTGFVCATKPLRLAYQHGNKDAAFMAVARSAFRRLPRLILPATIASVLSFILTALGGYRAATRCDSVWVRFDAPIMEPTFSRELRRLFRTLLSTWTDTDNPYDHHQWAMRPLLIGAFQVYICISATMGMRFRYRILVHLLLISYWWLNQGRYTETFGSPIALGTLLAELSLHHPTQSFIEARRRQLSFIIAPLLILLALLLGSYPQEHEDWTRWSLALHHTFVEPNGPDGAKGSLLIPAGTDAPRRFSSFAVQLCAIAVFTSAGLREALSNKYLRWLGHHSFAVYLVHGTILRTIGVWIIYGMSGEPWRPAGVNEDGSPQEQEWLHRRGWIATPFSVVVFVLLTYTAAWAWMRWVDSACHRTTMWLEERVFQTEDSASVAEKALRGEKQLVGSNTEYGPKLSAA